MEGRYALWLWCLMATWLTTVIAQSQVAAAGVRAMVVSHMGQLNNNPEENGDNLDDDEASLRRYGDIKSDVFEQGETRDFLQFMRKIKYDHRQRPEEDSGAPVAVNVSIYVSSIRSVSEITMDYSLELFFRENWIDSRLDWDPSLFKNKTELQLHESYTNFLWHPDTFMPNAIDSKNPMKQSITHRSLLRLRAKGVVLYSRRLSVTAECPMDLTLFPFDTQVCKLAIESYGFTADQIVYLWSGGSEYKALKLKAIRLPDFKLTEAFVTSETENYATGDYSRLYVCFVFSRSAGFCFLQLIIPSTAVVITSWVSLWMENETSFQDMISIILTITFLIFSYNAVMPRVSYIKAMDVYLGVCFFIVFFSLIKLALVKYMRQRLRMTRDTSIVAGMMPMIHIGAMANGTPPVIDGGNTLTVPNNNKTAQSRHSVRMFGHRYRVSRWGKIPCPQIEFTSRFMKRFHWISQMVFLFGFVFFCLFYFLVYPNITSTQIDPVCDRSKAEYFAEIKK